MICWNTKKTDGTWPIIYNGKKSNFPFCRTVYYTAEIEYFFWKTQNWNLKCVPISLKIEQSLYDLIRNDCDFWIEKSKIKTEEKEISQKYSMRCPIEKASYEMDQCAGYLDNNY